jgi:hypothetical protein
MAVMHAPSYRLRSRVHSPCCKATQQAGDLHTVMQASFLTSALAGRLACPVRRFDLIGKLERLEIDWASISGTVRGFGRYSMRHATPHGATDVNSGNPWRDAMEAVLHSGPAGLGQGRLDAFCRNLSVDYRCFGYRPAGACAHASAGVMDTPCPLQDRRLLHPPRWHPRDHSIPSTASHLARAVPYMGILTHFRSQAQRRAQRRSQRTTVLDRFTKLRKP